MYFGASIAVSAGSAFAVFTNPTLLRLVTRNGWMVSKIYKNFDSFTYLQFNNLMFLNFFFIDSP